jgi:hypothetical protein
MGNFGKHSKVAGSGVMVMFKPENFSTTGTTSGLASGSLIFGRSDSAEVGFVFLVVDISQGLGDQREKDGSAQELSPIAADIGWNPVILLKLSWYQTCKNAKGNEN